MNLHPLAGKEPTAEMLVNVPKLISSYYVDVPDVAHPEQRVSFGTSGHRGSSYDKSFNEWHILAISQAICDYRKGQGIDGPLFLGFDSHALSEPALATAVEVFAANDVEVMLAEHDEFTPTPVISHAILTYNKGRLKGFADGIVITPSHNPPADGGIKYNPPNGGPAEVAITSFIETSANEYLKKNIKGVKRIAYEKALQKPTTRRYNYRTAYIRDLVSVIDMEVIGASQISLGVDPLGGAGVHYWHQIAEQYGLNLTVVNEIVDPTFRFMSVDWDGQIRMDPSSPYAMQGLLKVKDKFEVSFSCDTDHDRHGIVTKSRGLIPTNHFLSASIWYLFQHRPEWQKSSGIGKTVVSSQMIDRIAKKMERTVYEVPVGFKWFVQGLLDGALGFVGEESAGASFLRRDGTVWTTDKDGIIAALLAAEMTAVLKKDPGEIYHDLAKEFGASFFERVDRKATPVQKDILKKITPEQVGITTLAGEKVTSILTKAPGNGASIGGIKVESKNGWFAVRPSGTENICKIYGESFESSESLKLILEEAEKIVETACKGTFS